MSLVDEYDYSGTALAEQHNTLLLLDAEFANRKPNVKPVFDVCGGTALLFHGVIAASTVDIDTANKLTDEVRNIVDPFISDNAADVVVLPKNYRSRMLQYKPDLFKRILVYYLSLEDLVISKLAAWRYKDREDLIHTSLVRMANIDLVVKIIKEEVDPDLQAILLERFKRWM